MSTFGWCAAFCAGDPEFDHRRDHKSFFRLFFLFTWRSWTPGRWRNPDFHIISHFSLIPFT